MSQQEILKFLKKNKTRWFCSNDIIKELKLANSTTSHNLKKLRNYNMLDYKYLEEFGRRKLYYRHKFKDFCLER